MQAAWADGLPIAATTNNHPGLLPPCRYIPGLTAQLELSLLRMLQLLQPTDAARLKVPLSRNQQLLLSVVAKASAPDANLSDLGCQPTQVAGRDATGDALSGCSKIGILAAGVSGLQIGHLGTPALPADPFGQGGILSGDGAAAVHVSSSVCKSSPVKAGQAGACVHTGGGAAAARAAVELLSSGLSEHEALLGLSRVLGPGLLGTPAQ